MLIMHEKAFSVGGDHLSLLNVYDQVGSISKLQGNEDYSFVCCVI